MSEKNTPELKTEKKDIDLTGRDRIAWNTIVSWLSQFVLIISGFILPRLIDSYIGQVSLGIWDFCWTFVNYMSVMSLGLGSSANRFVALYNSRGEKQKLLTLTSTVVALQIAMSLLVVVISLAISFSLPYFYADSLGEYLRDTQYVAFILGLSLAVQYLFGIARGIITGHHRWDINNGINAAASFTSLIFMTGVLVAGLGLVSLAVAYLSANIICEIYRVYMARQVWPEVKLRFGFVRYDVAKEMLSFGLKTFAVALPPMLLLQTINVIVVSTLGPAALAVFLRPVALIRHIKNFISKFTMILTPTAGSLQGGGDMGELRQFLLDSTKYSFAFSLPLFFVLFIFGDLLLLLWMGPEYANWGLMAFLCVGQLLPTAQDASLRIMIGMNKHGRLSVYTAVIMLVVFAALYLYKHNTTWDLIDAALIFSVPLTAAYGIVLPIYACKVVGLNILGYLYRGVLLPILYVLPFAIAAFLSRYVYETEQYFLFVVNVLIAGVLLLGVYYLYLLPEAFKSKLKDKLKIN